MGNPLRWGSQDAVDEDVDASASCVAALWPPVDTFTRYDWLLERLENASNDERANYESLRRGMEAYFGDRETMRVASVPRIVRGGEATHIPPIWVCYPELDQNVPFFIVQDLEKTWREAGGRVDVRVYPAQPHAFGHRPGAATDEFVDDLASFLATHL